MSRNSKPSSVEQRVRSALHARGLRFRKHVKDLPGKPDIVFTKAKVVVFIDGDYWHGYHFHQWKHRVSEYWVGKISRNRARDCKNFHALRQGGWRVLRIWEHSIKKDLDQVVNRIVRVWEARRHTIR